MTKTQVTKQALTEIAHRAEALEAEALELHEELVRARGTRETARPGSLERRPAGEYVMHRARPAASHAQDVTTADLYRRTQEALTDKPHTFRDLCEALEIKTVGENRVKSVLVRLQRDGHPVVNLGTGARAIWWIDAHDRIGALAVARRARR